jgi:hypothetical protein
VSDATAVKGSLLAFEKAQVQSAELLAGLTELQRKYVEARLSGMIPLHAGRAAGITQPEINTYRMERHPKVQRALGTARQQIIEKYDVGREDVLRGMFDAVQASGNATELVAAWREIGKIIGVYEPARVEVMHRIEDVTLDKLQRLPTKDLIELARGTDFVIDAGDDPYADEYTRIGEVSVEPVNDCLRLAHRANAERRAANGQAKATEDSAGDQEITGDFGSEDSEDL